MTLSCLVNKFVNDTLGYSQLLFTIQNFRDDNERNEKEILSTSYSLK